MDPKFLKPYDPQAVEGKVYEAWEKSGLFNPDNLPVDGKPFTVIMPPPNANGSLHAGHAVFVTIEDLIIRFRRMQGYKTLWLPGADHAGFETQVVYEKKLEKEDRSRFGMDPEDLRKEIMEFTLHNKSFMEGQLRELGASCDWSREKFTLDPDIIKTVYGTFEQLHKDGLVYRGKRTVNWCPKHQTSLSELETENSEEETLFYYFKYGPFTIGTVRPETKFGDKYVVMHPDDARYAEYKDGQTLEVEWINGPIMATIVKDEAVDPAFGSGVMTITPWHSQVDFEIAKRHNLDYEQIIDWRGKLLPIAGEFSGMKITEARPKIVKKLATKGLLVKTDEDYKNVMKRCYKCNTAIEPQVKDQWFVSMKPLAAPAIEAIEKDEVRFYPEHYKKIMLHWLTNIEDWNISRQIVWGIQLPVWYKTSIGSEMEAVHFKKEALYKKLGLKNEVEFNEFAWKFLDNKNVSWAGGKEGEVQLYIGFINFFKERNLLDDHWIKENRLNQPALPSDIHVGEQPPEPIGWIRDTDTFDTWFSSGQWPFATLGYPNGHDFKKFYPTQVMETAGEIIFFWVARMIMFGLYRTGHVPFKDVYLHGLVVAKDGQKMSKSRGNVISPLDLSGKYGTDALRMGLIIGNTPGTSSALYEEKIKAYKLFANKLWNIARFILENAPETSSEKPTGPEWEEFEALAKDITKDLEEYRFYMAGEKIYHYVWHRLADEILEESKPILKDDDKESRQVLLRALLDGSLRLLHPFMPFITEEIWGSLDKKELLMVAKWPSNIG